MRILTVLASVALAASVLSACDMGLTNESLDPGFQERNLDDVETIRIGTAHYEVVDSSCPIEWQGWSESEPVVIRHTEDFLELDFQWSLDLDGPMKNGAAQVAGDTVLMGAEGDVNCVVEAEALMEPVVVSGTVTEELASTSEINCFTTARYVITLEN